MFFIYRKMESQSSGSNSLSLSVNRNLKTKESFLSDEDLLQMIENIDAKGMTFLIDSESEYSNKGDLIETESDVSCDESHDETATSPIPANWRNEDEDWIEDDCSTQRNIRFTGTDLYNYRPDYPEDGKKLKPIDVYK